MRQMKVSHYIASLELGPYVRQNQPCGNVSSLFPSGITIWTLSTIPAQGLQYGLRYYQFVTNQHPKITAAIGWITHSKQPRHMEESAHIPLSHLKQRTGVLISARQRVQFTKYRTPSLVVHAEHAPTSQLTLRVSSKASRFLASSGYISVSRL